MSASARLPQSRILQLAEQVCAGTTSEESRAELNAALAHDKLACQAYLTYLDTHISIKLEGLQESEVTANVAQWLEEADARPPASVRPFKAVLASLAVLAAMLLIAFGVSQQTGVPRMATVTFATSDATWQGRTLAPGAELVKSHRFELLSGSAALRMRSGSLVTVKGPAKFHLNTTNSIWLESGMVLNYVPPGAEGFTVFTSDSEIVDLGTEFVVEKRPHQDTSVHVLQGRVMAVVVDQDRQPVQSLELTENRSARLSSSTSDASEIAVIPEHLGRLRQMRRFGSGVEKMFGQVRLFGTSAYDLRSGQLRTSEVGLLIPERTQIAIDAHLSAQCAKVGIDLPVGEVVDSYIYHFDPHQDASGSPRGSVTFHQSVLGLISDDAGLIATDEIFGNAKSFEQGPLRGFEANADEFSLSSDRLTLAIKPGISGTNRLDQCRILIRSDAGKASIEVDNVP